MNRQAVDDYYEEQQVARRAAPAKRSDAKDMKDILWKAADKLRGSMDAADYKHFVLGLVFLKYVSDAYYDRREHIEAELADEGITGEAAARLLEDRDEYTGAGVFWVPESARWETLSAQAKPRPGERTVGEVIDNAMEALGKVNPDLREALPRGLFNRRSVDERRLAELVDLIGRIGFGGQLDLNGERKTPRDVLGEVYEYFLGKFALAEGRRGGEYFTPPSVVKLLVETLEPVKGERVYDPCCGSGGMFVQAEKFIESHGGRAIDIAVYGQELNENTWRLAKMNLAIHGISADLGHRWGDTFFEDRHPDLRADVVLANPPFNISDWGGDRLADDPRWVYGIPPRGNANYAWLQHMAYKLKPKGRAGIVLANGSMSSKQSGEGDIRRMMVERDLVACLIALPGQMFRSTTIPACLWFLAKDKSSQGAKKLTDRRKQFLFIDTRELGSLSDRTFKEWSNEEIKKVADIYHAWRGTDWRLKYEDVPGLCYSASLDEVKHHDYVLTPSRYVGSVAAEEEVEPIDVKIERLTKELYGHFEESARLEREVRAQLGRCCHA
ncbi:class I SAM-dependent DNA methyltransferase [Amycolatopsis oliviviridis]